MRTRTKTLHHRAARAERHELLRAEPIPSVGLCTILGGEGEHCRIRTASGEQLVPLDASVDPLLLEEARLAGARALLELGPGGPRLVGVVQTSRSLRIDRQGVVETKVERFSVQARKEAVLKTLGAFLRLDGGEVELRGVRTLLRAREMAKVLARIISLN